MTLAPSPPRSNTAIADVRLEDGCRGNSDLVTSASAHTWQVLAVERDAIPQRKNIRGKAIPARGRNQRT
jgi:hypothetical protein